MSDANVQSPGAGNPDAPTPPDRGASVQVGDVVDGRYEIVTSIGAGGVGVVYEALHLGLDRRVALKVLKSDLINEDDEFRERFEREARVMSRLDHPNAVVVYDYGSHHGSMYIVMEYLAGHALEDEVGDGPIDMGRALEIAEQMCDVLTATHGMDLVHRDIKPDNIFITDTDGGPRATLVDFGLAFIDSDQELDRLTREGTVTGTPQFLSPEQARADDIGPPSDIYSLGCVLYELISGQPVVTGSTALELLNQHVFVPATSMRVEAEDRNVPAALDTFVLSMLAKDPAERPSAIEAATFLRKLMASQDLRGRGRPARLLQPRTRRAVTSSGVDDRRSTNAPAKGSPDPSALRQLGVIGDISADLVVAAHVSGWQPRPYASDGDFEVVVAMHPDQVTAAVAKGHPTVAVVGSHSVSAAVDLLKLGVADLLADQDPETIVRKVQRLYQSRRRRHNS